MIDIQVRSLKMVENHKADKEIKDNFSKPNLDENQSKSSNQSKIETKQHHFLLNEHRNDIAKILGPMGPQNEAEHYEAHMPYPCTKRLKESGIMIEEKMLKHLYKHNPYLPYAL